MSDREHEMDDMDDDDIMDEGAEFDIPQNAELNDDLMPEINNESEKKKVVGLKKRAPCWKHFTTITPEGHPKPRAACNWCGVDYACHSKLNGTKSLTHHLAYQCTKYPPSKKFAGSRQKLLSFQKKEHNGETSANLLPVAFSVDACKRALARMITIDELPFSFVEGEGFKDFISVVQPMWNPPRRLVMAKKIMVMYEEEKKTLKHTLKHQRVCLTTDTWTSVQNLNYLCLTGHFIDENWRYQKKILNFCVVPNHKGDTLVIVLFGLRSSTMGTQMVWLDVLSEVNGDSVTVIVTVKGDWSKKISEGLKGDCVLFGFNQQLLFKANRKKHRWIGYTPLWLWTCVKVINTMGWSQLSLTNSAVS
ncbi:zinc finger BED domain-containing protein DAYSLEEPER-like [Rhododendron vialii]|uniref:zinc finger BED domain-containing protein DAYSLEEPER-like n=1 Tax=Rhododendron vialii TaxID=182163 RepID=UPI00265D6239|nr:zinc finger BED domain-containing protein DAYSLEEPER-like [Rhododendron vialii]